MKNSILGFLIMGLLSGSCLHSQQNNSHDEHNVSEWTKKGTAFGGDFYVQTRQASDGTKRVVNGIMLSGDSCVTELVSGRNLEESCDGDYQRSSDLNPAISEEMWKRATNMVLQAPTSIAEYLAQKLATAERTASHPSYSNFISALGDNAVGGAKIPVRQKAYEPDSDDDSDCENNDIVEI